MAEQVNIQVLIDASKGSKSLGELEQNVEGLEDALSDLNKEIGKVEEGSDEFEKLSRDIEKVEKALDSTGDTALELALSVDKSTATIGELERSIEVLNEELKGVDRGSEEFKKLSSELIEANRQLKNVELSLEALDTEQVASELGSVTGAVGDVTSAFILLGGEGNQTLEEIGTRLETAIGISVGVKGAIEGISSGIKLYKNLGDQIKQSNTFLKLATAGQGALNVVTKLFAPIVGTSTKAVKGLRVALISTGIGAIVVLVGTLIAKWEDLVDALSFTTDAQKLQNQVSSEAIEKAGEELSALDRLKKTLNDNTLTREQQVDAVKDLQEQYPDLLQNVDAEKTSTDDLNRILELNIELTTLKAQAEALAELRAEKFKEILQEQADAQTGANVGILDYISSISQYTTIQGLASSSVNGFQTAQEIATEGTNAQVNALNEEISAFDELDKGIQDQINSKEKLLGVDRDSVEARKKAEEEAKKQEQAEKERQRNAERRAQEKKRQEEQARKDEEKRLQDLATLEEQIFQESLERDEDKEARRLTIQFEAQRKRITELVKDDEKLKTLLKQNEENFFRDLQAIEDKYADIDEKKRQELANAQIQSARNVQIIEEQIALERLSDAEKNGDKGLAILKKIDELRIKQLQENRDIELQNKELTAEQRLEIEKKYLLEEERLRAEARKREEQAEEEANKTKEDQRKALNEALISLAFDVAQQISDLSFEIAQERDERESEARLESIDKTFSAETDRLNQKVEDGLITQAEADRKAKELERKKNADILSEQKKLFEKTKKRNKAQAIVNGALAFTNALATTQPLVPLGLVAGAGVLVSTGVQIAKIESQQFARGGILRGKSHSQGGIKTPFGELEGGEAVINKRSTSMFKDTLSRINEAGGGVKFQTGGILGASQVSTTTNQSEDLGGILTSLNQTLSQPMRSFVVETDITESQNRVTNLERNADL